MKESFGCFDRSLTENITDVSRMNKSSDVTLTQNVIFIQVQLFPDFLNMCWYPENPNIKMQYTKLYAVLLVLL